MSILSFEQNEQLWDLLEKAGAAESERERAKLARKALKIDPDCLDAKVMIAESHDPQRMKTEMEKLIKAEEERLREDGVFDDDCIGHFYGLIETRPYMRARYRYLQVLKMLGKTRPAIDECCDLLRLCENDNMGVRYDLLGLYAGIGALNEAEALYERFGREQSLHALVPMAVLYYKGDKMTKTKNFFKKA